jgi:hypothetical protein
MEIKVTGWHVPEPEAMGVVLYRRGRTQRSMITEEPRPSRLVKLAFQGRATLFSLRNMYVGRVKATTLWRA